MKIIYRALSILIFLTPLTAHAHSNEYLDANPSLSVQGGQTRMAGPYHFELLTSEEQLTLYVTDHGGNPISVSGVSGEAIIINPDKSRSTIRFSEAGDNFLQGSGQFTLIETTDVWVSLSFPDQQVWKTKFTPLALKKKMAEENHQAHHDHSAHQHH